MVERGGEREREEKKKERKCHFSVYFINGYNG